MDWGRAYRAFVRVLIALFGGSALAAFLFFAVAKVLVAYGEAGGDEMNAGELFGVFIFASIASLFGFVVGSALTGYLASKRLKPKPPMARHERIEVALSQGPSSVAASPRSRLPQAGDGVPYRSAI